MSIAKLLAAGGVALASRALASVAYADDAAPAKNSVQNAAAKKKAAATPKAPDPEADEPSVTDDSVTEFNCELGNKITIYTNANDDQHIALRWKKRLHRLTRVGTTTGANRFENKLYGLVWIGIPAKGMLLDSKQGHQLANECRDAEQSKAMATAATPTTSSLQ